MRVGVVDYGMGNLGSVANALDHLGADFAIFRNPAEMVGFAIRRRWSVSIR